jgi:hypothetical protein
MEFIARLARAHGLQQAGVRRRREFAARLVAGSAELKFCPAQHTRGTVIWFFVSVPVLSEHTTVTHPSVSAAGSLRISAFADSLLLLAGTPF